jgi:hypothetical protein
MPVAKDAASSGLMSVDVAPVQNIAGVLHLGVLVSGSGADRDLVATTALVR